MAQIDGEVAVHEQPDVPEHLAVLFLLVDEADAAQLEPATARRRGGSEEQSYFIYIYFRFG